VPYFKKLAIDGGLSKDHFERLLAVGKSSVIRESLKKLGKRFSFHRGPKAKLPVWRYAEIHKVAEMLRPAIQKFLELDRSTSRTSSEVLKFLQKDYPSACDFLLKRIRTFQKPLLIRACSRERRREFPRGCEFWLTQSPGPITN